MDIYGFLLCSVLLSFCIHYLLSTGTFKKKRLPPGPIGLPILGSLLTIGNRPPESLAKLAKIYGPLMTVKFGMLNVVVASSADMAKEILQKNDRAFIGRPTPESLAAGKFQDMSLVWSSGLNPHWKKVRKICNIQLFTNQRMYSLQELRHPVIKKMIVRVIEAREAREPLDIGRLAFGATLNFLSNTMFSGDLFDMKSDGIRELKELIGLLHRVHKLLDDIIGQRVRRRTSDQSDRCGDFLDVLLDHTEMHGPEELNYQNIKILFQDLFVAGAMTTSTVIEWAMAELLHNPAILTKVKQELSNKIPPRELIQEQDITHLPYLDAVIKETMRLHPTTPLLLPHYTEEEAEIQGYIIPKHTQVFVNVWSILRDPAYWDDPTIFKPDRFLNSSIDVQGKDCKYIPFGAGRRICPGSNLAMRMVSLMVSNLVHGFDWELPGGLKFEDMDMTDGVGIAPHKHEPLVVIPVNAH
uniref:Cytochrome P450 monooxygenase isoform II n=1 Tax=Sesamum indicum TaxID=4182 RepID=B3EXG2_SESIN|nr:cytochrome P450 monooxygenase isoform II [Sesamum indicum]